MISRIKAISVKNNSILAEAEGREKWLQCSGRTIMDAQKGNCELSFENDGITVKLIKMVPSTAPAYEARGFTHKPTFPSSSRSYNDPEREKKIIRQSCLKCAIDLFNGQVKKEVTGDIQKYVITIAEDFEKWVHRE